MPKRLTSKTVAYAPGGRTRLGVSSCSARGLLNGRRRGRAVTEGWCRWPSPFLRFITISNLVDCSTLQCTGLCHMQKLINEVCATALIRCTPFSEGLAPQYH